MDSNSIKKPTVDPTRIGDYAAVQPLSGRAMVDESYAVSGNGRGGFVRKKEIERPREDRKSH
jgi:hypothetical protein